MNSSDWYCYCYFLFDSWKRSLVRKASLRVRMSTTMKTKTVKFGDESQTSVYWTSTQNSRRWLKVSGRARLLHNPPGNSYAKQKQMLFLKWDIPLRIVDVCWMQRSKSKFISSCFEKVNNKILFSSFPTAWNCFRALLKLCFWDLLDKTTFRLKVAYNYFIYR